MRDIIDIEGVNTNFRPSLFEIGQEISDYELVKLIMNRPGFKESLAKVDDNYCYLYDLLTKVKSPVVTMALFSNPEVIICEQYKMFIFKNIIQMIEEKKMTEAFKLH